jgi:hypothetical protein
MSAEDLSQPIVLNRADGSELRFPHCTPLDRRTFRAIFRNYRKMLLRENLRLVGVNGEAGLRWLNEFDNRHLDEGDVIEWLNDPDGQDQAILLSRQHDDPKAEVDWVYSLNLTAQESLTVAAGVMNIPLVTGQKKSKPGGVTGTSEEKPPSSGDFSTTPEIP